MMAALQVEWDGLSVDIMGPDRTEIVGRLVFLNCPVCSAVVAPATETRDFAVEHATHHVKQAQDWDAVSDLLESMVGPSD
jgi:hypothetical protein